MNENAKTGIFVAVAAVILLVALSTRAPVAEDDGAGLGEAMFPGFTDSFGVRKVEIVEFDEGQGDTLGITVEKIDTGWVIASHNGYPANAQDQLEKAVDLLSGLTKLSIESEDAGDHEQYGVKNPTEARAGDRGVGRLVRLSGADDAVLAELIIGKEFELGDDAQDRSAGDLRYVRLPGEPTVFSTRLRNPSALKPGFVDWVERDLLSVKGGYQFNSTSVSRIILDQHQIDGLEIARGPVYDLVRSIDRAGWEESNSSDLKPARHELLNTNAVNDLRSAFGTLEITGVKLKYPALATNLLSGNEFLNIPDQETLGTIRRSLQEMGYYAIPVADREEVEPRIEIFSNQGEVRAGLSDGVEYVMRFGSSFKAEVGADADDSRHIYILARFNEQLLDKPSMAPPPKPPADIDTNATAKTNLQKLKEEIEEQNRKRQEEFDTKKVAAQRRVSELNSKYAKWYYVITEDTFKKIQRKRADLVAEKEIFASHILVAYKGAKGADAKLERTKEAAKKRGDTLRAQVLAAGGDFEKAAGKESDDAGSKLTGGSLGSFTFSGISKDINAGFAAAAFSLDLNGTSPVIESPSGFHIIRRTNPPPAPPSGGGPPGPPGGGFPPGLFPRN
jgi:hypothetical protein